MGLGSGGDGGGVGVGGSQEKRKVLLQIYYMNRTASHPFSFIHRKIQSTRDAYEPKPQTYHVARTHRTHVGTWCARTVCRQSRKMKERNACVYWVCLCVLFLSTRTNDNVYRNGSPPLSLYCDWVLRFVLVSYEKFYSFFFLRLRFGLYKIPITMRI